MVYIPTPERPRVKETGTTHQPVVICIDTSGSMNEKAEDGRAKIEIVEQLVNSLSKIDLSERVPLTFAFLHLMTSVAFYRIGFRFLTSRETLNWMPKAARHSAAQLSIRLMQPVQEEEHIKHPTTELMQEEHRFFCIPMV